MELYSILSRARVYFLFPWLLLKSHHPSSFFPISRQIRVHTTCDQRFWKVLRQINPYVSNKWPLKRPFRHYYEVFIHILHSYLIFRCFGQLDLTSFSAHFE
ncbi:hypothetical protein T03_10569, partial [Trichinella britovi]